MLTKWTKPVLTAFSDQDPITRGGERIIQALIPGAKGQPHTTVQNAGRILVLHHGELREEGSHESLLDAGGLYARLYELQFAARQDASDAAAD